LTVQISIKGLSVIGLLALVKQVGNRSCVHYSL
jgi:hypothetical protein